MNDSVKRITISGESGYGPFEEGYKDKITIELNTICYDYIPFSKSEINPARKCIYNEMIRKMLHKQEASNGFCCTYKRK